MSTNENQPINPADEIIQMILSAKEKEQAANRARINYEQNKIDEVRKALAVDPFMAKCIEDARAWGEVYSTAISDLFTPGTVVQFRNGTYGVVVDAHGVPAHYIQYFYVTSPPQRRKHPLSFSLTRDTTVSIISHHSIPDAKLRKTAEKLIARIRMKDW